MKKVLLSLFTIAFTFAAFAQNAPMRKINPASIAVKKQAAVTGRETGQPEMMTSPVVNRATLTNYVGHTYYDLQTNASLSRRVVAHEDGTVSMVWTTSNTDASTRGTGYNYFDGTSLINDPLPIERVENTRAGWGTIGTLGTGGNIGEVIISHDGATGLVIMTRETKGTGTWKTSELRGPVVNYQHGSGTSTCLLWPAIATVADTIHLIACTESDTGYRYNGIQTCLLYFRGVYDRSTQDVTWTSPEIVGGITADKQNSFAGDSYSISANGSNVAVLFGESTTDIFYWLSNDGGRNWNKHVIFDTPIPDRFLENVHAVLDTPFVTDGSNAVLVDDNGVVHVAFSLTRYLNESITDNQSSWYPLYDAMVYWNSTMNVLTDEANPAHSLNPESLQQRGFKVFDMPDLTGDDGILSFNTLDGHITSYGVTLVSMPQLAWEDGVVYLTYCAEVEYPFVQWDMNKMYRGVFITKSDDNGNTWNDDEISWITYGPEFMYMDWDLYNAIPDPSLNDQTTVLAVTTALQNSNSENVFPAMSNVADGKIALLWQTKFFPGSDIREVDGSDVCTTMVDLNWTQLDVNQVGVFNNTKAIPQGSWQIGVTGVQNSIKNMKVYPNPASSNVKIVIEANENAPALLTLTNLLGQTVYSQQIDISAGMSAFDFNVSEYPSGFYVINVRTGMGNTTQKLVIQ